MEQVFSCPIPTVVGTFDAKLTFEGVRQLILPKDFNHWMLGKTADSASFGCDSGFVSGLPIRVGELAVELQTQLSSFLAGQTTGFTVAISPIYRSAFAEDIGSAMQKIPYGSTTTYAELAEAAGHPGAARAAGTACRKNPLVLIIPCHRVCPASGGVGNYGGSAEAGVWKAALLDLEKQPPKL